MINKKKYRLTVPDADTTIRNRCMKRMEELYGSTPSESMNNRFEKELSAIIENGFSSDYLLAAEMAEYSNYRGYPVCSRGTIGSSFVAFLLGISEINPLSADIDIDPEIHMGLNLDREPDIAMNFAPEIRADVVKHLQELFGEDRLYCAGTRIQLESGEVQDGIHPGGIFILPDDVDMHEITDVRPWDGRGDFELQITAGDYHDVCKSLKKYDLLTMKELGLLHDLTVETGHSYKDIRLDERTVIPECAQEVLHRISSFSALKREMFVRLKPNCFSYLMRIEGFVHSHHFGTEDAYDYQKLAEECADSFYCRDDIMRSLMEHGVDKELAYQVMRHLLRGKGISEKLKKALGDTGVPSECIEKCGECGYLYPKSQIAEYALVDMGLLFYASQYPKEYGIVYEKRNG